MKIIPPHCDTLDGPVIKAAEKAFDTGNVNHILPWVGEEAEKELKEAFERATKARKQGGEAAALADYWFYETAVRLHRRGEGAPYTGLKPAGLDWGPVVPKAEKAIEERNPIEVIHYLSHVLDEELRRRFHKIEESREFELDNVDLARKYIQAELGFVLFAHGIYAMITGQVDHDESGVHKH